MSLSESEGWRKCSTCKKSIGFHQTYYVCSVSTCNGQRTGYVFCSVLCFESHLPGARHREAGAIEKTSPSAAPASQQAGAPQRLIVRASSAASLSGTGSGFNTKKTEAPKEVLVIASRLKEYIQQRSEFNTSATVMDVLSDQIRLLCDRAIDNARADGRKTVLDRDFDFLKSLR